MKETKNLSEREITYLFIPRGVALVGEETEEEIFTTSSINSNIPLIK